MENLCSNLLRSSSKIFRVQSKGQGVINQIVYMSSSASGLKEVLKKKIPIWANFIKKFREKHNKTQIGKIDVNSIYAGMRGMYGMVWETSQLDAETGIRFRGLTIDETRFACPKEPGSKEPLVEGFLWFLISGEIPTLEQAKALACELADRGCKLPPDVEKVIKACDKKYHPMDMLAISMNCLSNHSKFNKAFEKGMKKSEYWDHSYEDGMDLIARCIVVAGKIYRHRHMDSYDGYQWSQSGDWSLNFANLLDKGDDKKFVDFLRLYFLLHSDHEGGNVSAHAMHLLSSALADMYKSFAGAMNGLAGPLHGLATQTTLQWLQKLQEKHGDSATPENVASFVDETLKSGSVVPGYGHAVLRKTDPRFLSQMNFAKENKIETPLVKLVETVYKTVPPLLLKGGKVKNPWPNVDAHSGSLLQHFCITDLEYYTVMFGVARSLGVCANTIWTRALGYPIERPNSISTCVLLEMLNKKESKKDDKKDLCKTSSKK